MPLVNDLLKGNVIDREKLLLERFSFLNIDEKQVIFIAKILRNNNIDFSNVSIEDISKTINMSDETSKNIIESLISDSYIAVISTPNGLRFNFNKLTKILLETYLPPKENSTLTKKVKWILEKVNFDKEQLNEAFLSEFVEKSEWKKLLFIIEKISTSTIEKVTMPLIITSYESIAKTKESNESLKEILSSNWLEK